jgi:hypothetical protein
MFKGLACLLYLPPSSPDYNALEGAWAKVKAYLRKAKARTVEALYQALAQALETISPADALHFVRHAGVIQSDAGRIIPHDLLLPLKETTMFTSDRDQVLCERLNRHPRLRARVESLLQVVEEAAGDCEKADAAEQRVIEELRQLGNEALTAWAERGVEKSVVVAQAESDWRPGGKKTVLVHNLRTD